VDRVYRVEVIPLEGETQADYLLSDIASLGVQGVQRIERSDLYFLRGALSDADVQHLCDQLLVDPIVQKVRWGLNAEFSLEDEAIRVEVGLLQGVTDSVADNLLARARLLGMTGLAAAASAQSYLLYGDLSEEQVQIIAQRLLYNDVIEYYQIGALTPIVGITPPEVEAVAERISVNRLSDKELLTLSHDRLLSLDLAEMHAIQRYFDKEGREPTDVELESLAQTWSEHCVHKTFKGIVEYSETTEDGGLCG